MKSLIIPYKGKHPKIHPSAFIAPNAVIIGDVEIGENSSIWFNCVIRGDVNHIRIGKNTNIQDNTVIHVSRGHLTTKLDAHGAPTIVGSNVTVGHSVILHGCILEDASFIGMHSTILDKAVVESGAMVAAQTLVSPGKRIIKGEIWAGNPAKFFRNLNEGEKDFILRSANNYVELGRDYK
jgi:carbonic anhydrase/acetyltransferase-like protein (isoleucine patch superfamily)